MPQIQYAFSKNDEYYTPAYAVYPIIGKLKPRSTIWCPFDRSESNFVKVLEGNGFKVIHTHIADGQDFFKVEVPECDYIISNPPYSLKGEVFRRLYEIGKPFAMLVNLQGIFDSRDRFELFKGNKVELMWLNPRVDYIKEDGSQPKSVPFQSGYLCCGLCDNQIEFEFINKTKG